MSDYQACPFCKGTGYIKESILHRQGNSDVYCIECTRCDLVMTDTDRNELLGRWNRRG